LLKRDVLNGCVKTKHCSKRLLLSGKPHNRALAAFGRRLRLMVEPFGGQKGSHEQ
jgi:hypothetical protein